MRVFDYRNLPKNLFDRSVGDLNVHIYEDRGKAEQLKRFHPEAFDDLQEKALMESVEASTRIEGLPIDIDRARADIKSNDCSHEETEQLVGYARALRVIEAHHDELELSSGTMVNILEQIYCNHAFGKKSRYRKNDYAQMIVGDHVESVPVSPIPAFETPLALGSACDSLAESFCEQSCSPVILSAVFTVDFLCIRPFDTANGRISRLFARLLLEKAGFDIARYISIEGIMEQRASEYYDALNGCVEGWDRANNDYTPYAHFWLDVIHTAYQKLFEQIDLRISAGRNKTDRVCMFIERSSDPVTKRQMKEAFPDISESTIENALGSLVKNGSVSKIGAGRSTAYVWGPGNL